MKKLNRNLIIGLGTVTAVAAPVATVVSCSLGTIFKNQIGSEGEAKRAAEDIIDEMISHGKRTDSSDKWLASWDSFNFYDGMNGHVNNASSKYDQTKIQGATADYSNMQFGDGNKVAASVLAISNKYLFKYSLTPVTLNDGTKVKILIVYQLKKQDGGGLVKLFSGDAFSGWAHNVVGGAVMPETTTIDSVHTTVDNMDNSKENWFNKYNDDIWKWWN